MSLMEKRLQAVRIVRTINEIESRLIELDAIMLKLSNPKQIITWVEKNNLFELDDNATYSDADVTNLFYSYHLKNGLLSENEINILKFSYQNFNFNFEENFKINIPLNEFVKRLNLKNIMTVSYYGKTIIQKYERCLKSKLTIYFKLLIGHDFIYHKKGVRLITN